MVSVRRRCVLRAFPSVSLLGGNFCHETSANRTRKPALRLRDPYMSRRKRSSRHVGKKSSFLVCWGVSVRAAFLLRPLLLSSLLLERISASMMSIENSRRLSVYASVSRAFLSCLRCCLFLPLRLRLSCEVGIQTCVT